MEQRWEEFADALESGDTDRVNVVIDEIKELDIDERARLFEESFDDLMALYADSDEGYVRQSTVRVTEQLTPGLAAVVNLTDDEQSTDDDVEQLLEQTDTLCGFLLEAITDKDGRVRQSAKRGLQDVFRTYDALKNTETIEALIAELDEMATEYSGKRHEHILEAKEDAEFNLQPGYARMLKEFQQER